LPQRGGKSRAAVGPTVPDPARPLRLEDLTQRRIRRATNLRAWISYLHHRFAAAQQP
jgi:hypothetical protein